MSDIKDPVTVTEQEHSLGENDYDTKKSISDRLSLFFASIALLSDGYQALIISSVESCLSKIYGSSVVTSTLTTRISNALLIGDIVGMLGFGLIIDRLGRKFGIVLCTAIVCLVRKEKRRYLLYHSPVLSR